MKTFELRETSRFGSLDTSAAPGQTRPEVQSSSSGPATSAGIDEVVDFSHGDVVAFPPFPGASQAVSAAIQDGRQAYSEYRGHSDIRQQLAERLAAFTGASVDPHTELIITPGTQAGLFLALSSLVEPGDKVMVVEPDYSANRRIVQFLHGEVVPITLTYRTTAPSALDLDAVRSGLAAGARVLVMSNPNNPTGSVYPVEQLQAVADLANEFGAMVVVDQLYSRLIYAGVQYSHLRSLSISPSNVITLMGPSKTESLSGFRTGIAIGPPKIIQRMEHLLGIVSLRTGGYNQSALRPWLTESPSWIHERTLAHQAIRDDIATVFSTVDGVSFHLTEGGSYIYLAMPELSMPVKELVGHLRTTSRAIVTYGTEFAPSHTDSIRLNFSQHHARAVAACERMAEEIARLAR